MKLKQHAEDFHVEELTDVLPDEDGPYAFYRLEKRGWTTPDAVAVIRRRWKLEVRRVAYAGLKDRHAHTIQYFTVFHGPRRNLRQHNIGVRYLGQVHNPYKSEAIRGNRFGIILRSLGRDEVSAIEASLSGVRADGVPNYFDDQRFGSARGGEFIARLLVLGRLEDALRMALTAPYEFDRAEKKKEKTIIRSRWGDWATLRADLLPGQAQKIVDFLARHPTDLRGALLRLPPDLRGLHMSAYQGYLWNRILARWLRLHIPNDQLTKIHTNMGELPAHRRLDDAQRRLLADTRLPLPSARMQLDPSDPYQPLVETVLAEDGITLEKMKLIGMREMFFSKGDRAALCLPEMLQSEVGDDERNHGRTRVKLTFDLPRGCYATLIVKRLTACP